MACASLGHFEGKAAMRARVGIHEHVGHVFPVELNLMSSTGSLGSLSSAGFVANYSRLAVRRPSRMSGSATAQEGWS